MKLTGMRTRLCRKVAGKRKKACVFVQRDKHGRFKKFTNIGRAIKSDTRVHSRHKPKHPGYGYAGDY